MSYKLRDLEVDSAQEETKLGTDSDYREKERTKGPEVNREKAVVDKQETGVNNSGKEETEVSDSDKRRTEANDSDKQWTGVNDHDDKQRTEVNNSDKQRTEVNNSDKQRTEVNKDDKQRTKVNENKVNLQTENSTDDNEVEIDLNTDNDEKTKYSGNDDNQNIVKEPHSPGKVNLGFEPEGEEQVESEGEDGEEKKKKRSRWCKLSEVMFRVYVGHGLSAWGDRMWMFAVGLFLIILSPESLQLTASFGLASAIAIILFGEVMGRWIDRSTRLTAARVSLAVQNISVVICCIFVVLVFEYSESLGKWKSWFFVFIIISAVIAALASSATKICMEKDWIVVIAGDDLNKLARMNSVFRTLDLTTFILAPVLVGQLMTYGSNTGTALFIAGWNVVSLFVEYYLLHTIYKSLPKLSHKEIENSSADTLLHKLIDYFEGWKTYFMQKGRFAGVGLAFLYMTVLGFDNITTGYCYAQGVSESMLGIATALGALMGVLGALTFPKLRTKIGIQRCGLMGYLILVSSLSLCVISIFTAGSPFDPESLKLIGSQLVVSDIKNTSFVNTTGSVSSTEIPETRDPTSITLLLVGVIVARFGLWIVDLSITQILQECVSEGDRGVVGGVQDSLNYVMETVKFALVVLIPLPEQFGLLILLSFSFICLGWLCYAFYSREIRGHILPFHNQVTQCVGKEGSITTTTTQ